MDVTLQNAAMAYGKALSRGGEVDPSGSDSAAVSGAYPFAINISLGA